MYEKFCAQKFKIPGQKKGNKEMLEVEILNALRCFKLREIYFHSNDVFESTKNICVDGVKNKKNQAFDQPKIKIGKIMKTRGF